ncbi:MAG: HAD family phosphatase, partial [Clostridia bacterium]|nr:HAD family phosphatase [Clostridia bacterium]
MKIKAAIFDLDGTLVDSLMFWDMLWAELGKKYLKNESFRPTEADDKAVRTLTMRDAMELIHQKYGIGSDGMALTDEVNRMISDFYTYKVGLKKGTLEFLERLHKDGVRMVIASATAPEYVELAL